MALLSGDADSAMPARSASPLTDDDLQLALYVCHELSYGGIRGVSDELEWEWDPRLVTFRTALESAFLGQLLEEVGEPVPALPDRVGEAVFDLVNSDESPSLARYLETQADLDECREFVIHRSAYQLKEADPHTFGIPRLRGAPKAAMVEVQADEYGGGNPARMHSALFAKAMAQLGLDPTFGAYVDVLPGTTLATVNLISVFGLRRRWRGALVGHLAGFEISSAAPNRRYGNALRRLGLGTEATDFFDEHVEADSVHENIAAYDMAGALARQEPDLAGQILFGVRSLLHLDGAFAAAVLDRWERGESSLFPDRVAAAA